MWHMQTSLMTWQTLTFLAERLWNGQRDYSCKSWTSYCEQIYQIHLLYFTLSHQHFRFVLVRDLTQKGEWLPETQTTTYRYTANWPDFTDNIANTGHCKKKQWNKDKDKEPEMQCKVLCQSMCPAIIHQTRILRLSDMTLGKA